MLRRLSPLILIPLPFLLVALLSSVDAKAQGIPDPPSPIYVVQLPMIVMHSEPQVLSSSSESPLINGSFETLDPGTDHPTGWVGGHAKSTSWIVPPDGKNYGYALYDETMSQIISMTPGSNVELTFWSGTHPHDTGDPIVRLEYLDSEGEIVAQAIHSITHLVESDNHLAGPFNLRLPAAGLNVVSLRVVVSGNFSGWAKVDGMGLSIDTPRNEEESPETSRLYLPLLVQ